MDRRLFASAWTLLCLLALLNGCGKLNLGGSGGGPGPSPSPTASASPTPGACATPDIGNSNLVVVAMGSAIGAASSSFGNIGGYAPADLSTGFVPNQAMLINQTLPTGGTTITSNNVIQFTNLEPPYSNINHSAVGFTGEAFPDPATYRFPKAAASPSASVVSSTKLWSTGRIATNGSQGQNCYSQEFTLKPGVYYFGDLDYYALTTFRNVLIVATPGPGSLKTLKRL
jgi:hypothetical protein